MAGLLCCGMACKLSSHVAPAQAANEAELAAIRSRIEAALGAGVGEKRIGDLLSLAQFQMLSRDARVVRSPTVVLSMRPQRSTTLRCAPRAPGSLRDSSAAGAFPSQGVPAGHSHGQIRGSEMGVLMSGADRHCALTHRCSAVIDRFGPFLQACGIQCGSDR